MATIGTKTQRAFKRFHKHLKQVETASGLNLLHGLFANLADKGFLVSNWEHPSQLAALAKYLVLFGAQRPKKPWYDLAGLLNPYKDFWAAAESENIYENDEVFLGTFIFRFIYQQLPFLIFPERVESLFDHARKLYAADTSISKQFEDRAKIPLTVFTSVAQRLYELFRSAPSANSDGLRREISAAEQHHLDAALEVLAATASRFEQLYAKTRAQTLAEKPYEFNPLLRYPLIRLGVRYYAPFPELIPYAATRGLYFYLLDEFEKEFSEAFGLAFQRYSAELARTKLATLHVLTEEDERGAGWRGKTNDFTVFDQDKAALFECKTSGLFFRSKSHASLSEVQADIRKTLANSEDRSGLFQLYDKLKAIKEKKLPPPLMARYGAAKEFYPVIILYDRIQHGNAPHVLGNIIKKELAYTGITDFDFQIWHIEEVENLCELLPAEEFIRVVAKKFSSQSLHNKDLNAYLYSRTQKRYLRPHLFLPRGEGRAWQTVKSLADETAVEAPDSLDSLPPYG